MECSVCLELPEKRIPARHLSSTCRPRHIYATFVGECTCAMVWCVWCARKAADYRLNQAIRAAAAVHGDDKDDDGDDSEAEMVPCPMCRAPVHPTRFFTHPRPLGGAERARLVREYRPPPCWFIWGDNLCRFGRLCRNSHAGLDGRPLQRGPPLSRQDWLARARLRLPEPFHMPPSFLDRSGRAWFHTERHGYVRIVDPTSPQVWEKLNTAQRFSPMSDKHPTEAGAAGAGALGLGLGGGLALSTGLSLSVSAADLDADGGGWRWLASTS